LVDLFVDSYALVAYLEGNPRYVRIFGRKSLATSSMNLLEVYSTLLRKLTRDEARAITMGFIPIVVPLPPDLAYAAGDYRHAMRSAKKDCSYIDAWGYAGARHLGIKFLTGDPAFKGEENVEFVR